MGFKRPLTTSSFITPHRPERTKEPRCSRPGTLSLSNINNKKLIGTRTHTHFSLLDWVSAPRDWYFMRRRERTQKIAAKIYKHHLRVTANEINYWVALDDLSRNAAIICYSRLSGCGRRFALACVRERERWLRRWISHFARHQPDCLFMVDCMRTCMRWYAVARKKCIAGKHCDGNRDFMDLISTLIKQ